MRGRSWVLLAAGVLVTAVTVAVTVVGCDARGVYAVQGQPSPVDSSLAGRLGAPPGATAWSPAPAAQPWMADAAQAEPPRAEVAAGSPRPTSPAGLVPLEAARFSEAAHPVSGEADARAGLPAALNRRPEARTRAGPQSGADPVSDAAGGAAPSRFLLPAPAFDEELWIISKREPAARADLDDQPGSGGLVCVPGPGQQVVPVPLEHTDVRASVSGWISSVTVTQRFHNPFSGKIEAVYVFPLPENAAVNDFIMTVGERRIRGVIRERQEAERLYQQARSQGHVASLMTQERPNIFTQRVANIEPGRGIDITITYFSTLAYHDDAFEFVFPMVVGPRFNPPSTSRGGQGAGIGAAARGQPGASGQAVEVQYLRPGERSGHDIALAVEIDAGAPLGRVESPSHAVDVARPTPARAVVTLGRLDRLPNKDFVLRYSLAGEGVRTGVVTHADAEGVAFAAMIVPPTELASLPRRPMEMIFLVDCSGSMKGYPIEKAKAAIERVAKRLRPEDTFQIIRFASEASRFADAPAHATPENIRRGIEYARSLSTAGGTYMIEGVRAALSYPHDPARERFVCFLTDGFIGNEAEILIEVRRLLGPSHIFSFGVGQSVNRFLMDSLARVGRGAVAYVGLHDDVADAMDPFFDRVSHAALTDLSLDFGGAATADVYPRRLPDLYIGRPIMIVGRLAPGQSDATLTLRGRAGGAEILRAIPIGPAGAPNPAVAAVWARGKIGALEEERYSGDSQELIDAIRRVALQNNLVSAFTAFVAVDSLTRTQGEIGATVQVPVHLPEGVKYQTTIPER